MSSTSRWTILSAFLLGVFIATLARAEDPSAAQKPPVKPHVLVTISKETTYITEPLRADGYPDYVAALNQRCRQGVTPENNAAVLFWKAVGPAPILKEDRETYFKMLGIAPLQEKGDYFITSDAWINRHKTEMKQAADGPEGPGERDPLLDQYDSIRKRPWSKQEFPHWAEWLSANEKPLALLVEASKRPRRYDPLLGGMVMTVLMPAPQHSRDVIRALCARAMLRLGEGRVNDAWEDLLACHRLARLIGQGPTLVEMLVAIAIDGATFVSDHAILKHATLTAAQIARMRDDIAKLAPMPRMTEKINLSERFFYLDCVAMVAREGLSSAQKLSYCEMANGFLKSSLDLLGNVMVDWDSVLECGNPWYDRIVNSLRKPNPTERKEAIEHAYKDLRKLQDIAKDRFARSVLSSPRKAHSELIGSFFVCLLLPATSACITAEDRGMMQLELTKLAFALAAYRADHGSYPAKLADLKPKYVAELPKDIFNDAELHYQLEGDGYLLYSVGVNGKDDGGKGFDDHNKDSPEGWDDLVVRMPAVVKQEPKR